jgi:PAS domain-containing protein
MTVAPQTTRLRRRHNDYVIGDDGNLRAALRECVQFTWMRIPAAIVLSTFLIALVRVEYGLIWLGVVLGLEGLGVGISAQRLKSGKGLAAVAVGIGLAVSICWTAHELLLWRAGGYIARIAMVMDVFTIALYAVLGAHRDLRLMAALLAPQFAMLCWALVGLILTEASPLFQPFAIAATVGSCAVVAAAGVLMHKAQRRLNSANHDLSALAQRLELRETFLEEVSNLVLVGGFEYELATRQLSFNAAFLRLFELAPEAQPDMGEFTGWVERRSRPALIAALRAAWGSGEAWDLELPMTTATGRRILVRTVGRAVFANHRPTRLIGAAMDITQEREVRSALADLAARLRWESKPDPALQRSSYSSARTS